MLRQSWNALPLALRVAMVLIVPARLIAVFGFELAGADHLAYVLLGYEGLEFAIRIASVVGILELVRILPLARASGAKLVAAGWIAALVLSCVYFVLDLQPSWEPAWGHQAIAWGWFGSDIAVAIGFAWIAWKRPAIAALGGVLWAVGFPPPPLIAWVHGHATLEHAQLVVYCVGSVMLLALAMIAVSDVPAGFVIPERRRAKSGFGMLAHSQWWRLMAVVVVPLMSVVLASSHDAWSVRTAITIVSVVNGATFAWFSFGALMVARSNMPSIHRGLFVTAGLLAAWCAAVTLTKLSYGSDGSWGSGLTHAYEIALPIIATVSLVLVAIGTSRFATQIGADALAARATRLVWLVVILQGGVVLITFTAARAGSTGAVLFLALCAVIAGIVVLASSAAVAGAAGELIHDEPTSELPPAQLV